MPLDALVGEPDAIRSKKTSSTVTLSARRNSALRNALPPSAIYVNSSFEKQINAAHFVGVMLVLLEATRVTLFAPPSPTRVGE